MLPVTALIMLNRERKSINSNVFGVEYTILVRCPAAIPNVRVMFLLVAPYSTPQKRCSRRCVKNLDRKRAEGYKDFAVQI